MNLLLKKWLLLLLAAILPKASFGYGMDEPANGIASEWKAETIVDEAEVNRIGMDEWFKSEEISDAIFKRMWKKSWKANCPLDRRDLRYLKVLHRNADGLPQRGEMVVNASIADKVVAIFRRLYEAGYRIERMVLIDNYNADDKASMCANNSSSFNFRFMTGSTTKISKHGLGLAIDINPFYNPYVKRNKDGTWHIEPASAKEYAFDRNSQIGIPYAIDHNDLAYKLFTEAGFRWGGDWRSLKDYQHFEID
ncbi:M15 family metallopeptidase [Phocaeicola sp.]|uniref:M15 family metallopeptidase n=1 Tax=Phocaeicola sp. TaxID=2773926 RepID=UPI0026266DB5|nr:M15 family metallopeptidase [Phocaeicola sp.]